MTITANDVLNLKSILTTPKENGTKHFIIVQDIVQNPEKAFKSSRAYYAA